MNTRTVLSTLVVSIALLGLAACGQPLVQFGSDDAASDVSTDTTTDPRADTSADTAPDAAPDTDIDTGMDTSTDDADAGGTDTDPPGVIATVPRDGESGYPVFQNIEVTFDEAMDPSSLDTSSFTLSQGGNSVSGTVSVATNTATFAPNSNLDPGTTYDGTITTDATDLAGNALENEYNWSFTTADPDAPQVTATNPSHLATNVALQPTITATFDQQMDGSTIDSSSFKLTSGGSPVSGSVTVSGNQATFIPNSALQTSTDYTMTATTAIESASGDALTQDVVWTFSTTADPGLPAVTGTRPLDLQTNYPPHARIRASFSEAMDPSTLDTSSFTLTQNGTPVSGKVRVRRADTRAIFIPSSELDPNKTYQATVTTSAQDTQGNGLVADYVWTFSTGDTVRPTVVRANPGDGDQGVSTTTTVKVRFSKRMDKSTIDTTSFKLEKTMGGSSVPGTVMKLSSKTATFNPTSQLASGTEYTLTLTTDIKDRDGNNLLAKNTLTFKTAP